MGGAEFIRPRFGKMVGMENLGARAAENRSVDCRLGYQSFCPAFAWAIGPGLPVPEGERRA
jgi:hypothetical protein